jgi:NAD(P)-dependent dehydrogenase (short-subunit alcohol dehydrogenase family)
MTTVLVTGATDGLGRVVARDLAARGLDVLVNNAGLISEERRVNGDGLELTFQVNYLAPFVLTNRLVERGPPRRVVHVASMGQVRPDFDDLMLEDGYDEWRAYRQSKMAYDVDARMRLWDVSEQLVAG